ncbi:BZ3500_MvSof-1268-A1-R1_Chr1-1g00877 [Microbotryum saponariae]|uniref:Cysteine-rich PDZ-binding protein n=1 Tax=Microbotryum saponariae TaxID=289078 RepID=A0A2X0K8M3_9BASI|nr:BZ3500_MvSof-1268-A1-R1_Chr1-1g00877 [Microbotryum saponariae]SCZ92832.1 BZ3501_MvSof-1269-A2-R1_Chr1-1g00474 [Microbotryum saponariae]
MPCAKCEKALYAKGKSSLACTDVWRAAGAAGDRNTDRKIGENKLLSSKARYSPYAPAAAAGTARGAVAGSSKGLGGVVDGKSTFGKCETCKVTVARAGAKFCQSCAYKKGICSICSKKILDTSQYKMSSK